MLPPISALAKDAVGQIQVQAIAGAGSVPAGSPILVGHALKPDGTLYVVLV